LRTYNLAPPNPPPPRQQAVFFYRPNLHKFFLEQSRTWHHLRWVYTVYSIVDCLHTRMCVLLALLQHGHKINNRRTVS
jgi:hypothetical protein